MDREFIFETNCLGDNRKRPHVVYQRDEITYCIYCGKEADTREHCPPRCFLRKPYPCDLPVLPACRECNNGFSGDELYVKSYVKSIREVLRAKKEDALSILAQDRKEVIEAKQSAAQHLNKGFFFDEKVGRILKKLAIGHMVYELSEGYYTGLDTFIVHSIKYTFRPMLTEDEWEELNAPEVINNYLLPEIGSRVFRHIYVVQPILVSKETNAQIKTMLLLLDWTDVQETVYKYIAFAKGNAFYVRIVMYDFFFAEVVFKTLP